MKVEIFNIDGSKTSNNAELSDEIFGIEPNETLIYEDVRRYLANKRQGTAKTKERGEVRASTRKLYRQKGTGNARRGAISSPLLRGGGTVFGPKPRTYTVKMTKKMRQTARKSALSAKMNDKALVVTENFTFDEPKTARIIEILNAFDLNDKKVMFLTPETDPVVYKSARNIPGISVLEAYKPTTYEILNADAIIIQKDAIEVLENSIEPKVEEEAA